MHRCVEPWWLLAVGVFIIAFGRPAVVAAQESLEPGSGVAAPTASSEHASGPEARPQPAAPPSPAGAPSPGAQLEPEPAPRPAPSEAPAPAMLKVGSFEVAPDLRLFADYWIDLGAEHFDNGFHVTRAYVGVRVKVTPWLGGRLTLDVAQAADLGASGDAVVTDGSAAVEPSRLQGSSLARLKYGYVDARIERARLAVRFGVLQTPWLEWAETIEGTRFLRRLMLEGDLGVPSADFGLALIGTITDYVAYFVGVYNGEGYAGLEGNPFKDLSGRLTLRPAPHVRGLECLQVSGYARGELVSPSQGSTHETSRRYGGALTYRLAREAAEPDCSRVEGERLALWFQAFYGQDGVEDALVGSFGLSGGLRVELPARLFLIGRLDRFDPDLGIGDDARWTVIGAFGVRLGSGVAVALDYQAQILPGQDDTHRLGIHAELRL